ncbi:MAG: hypothetical protein SGPRY_014156, partial [Prymnesium sp.]
LSSAYSSQLKLLTRAVRSLRTVRTATPIAALLSGHLPHAESHLSTLGIELLTSEAPTSLVPAWASPWARASFAKLRVLTLTSYKRVLLLDTDVIVMRNIDHLLALQAPAFVFSYKCYPRRELRTSLMLLSPNRSSWRKARALLRRPVGVYDDNGEGSVWRQLFPWAYELPASYGALRSSDFSTAEWAKVHVLHDPNLLRRASRAGFQAAGVEARIKQLDAETELTFKGFGPVGWDDEKQSQKKIRRGKRRGRRLAK